MDAFQTIVGQGRQDEVGCLEVRCSAAPFNGALTVFAGADLLPSLINRRLGELRDEVNSDPWSGQIEKMRTSTYRLETLFDGEIAYPGGPLVQLHGPLGLRLLLRNWLSETVGQLVRTATTAFWIRRWGGGCTVTDLTGDSGGEYAGVLAGYATLIGSGRPKPSIGHRSPPMPMANATTVSHAVAMNFGIRLARISTVPFRELWSKESPESGELFEQLRGRLPTVPLRQIAKIAEAATTQEEGTMLLRMTSTEFRDYYSIIRELYAVTRTRTSFSRVVLIDLIDPADLLELPEIEATVILHRPTPSQLQQLATSAFRFDSVAGIDAEAGGVFEGRILTDEPMTSYRLFGVGGIGLIDLELSIGEAPPAVGDKVICHHPTERHKWCQIKPTRVKQLLQSVETKPYRWSTRGETADRMSRRGPVQTVVLEAVDHVRIDHVRLENPTPYKHSITDFEFERRRDVADAAMAIKSIE